MDREHVIKNLRIAISDERSERLGGYGFVRLEIEEADTILNLLEEQENESMDKLRIENSELIQRILQLEKDLEKERAYNYALVTIIKNTYPPEEGR